MPIDPLTGLAVSTGVSVLGGILGDRAAAGDRVDARGYRRRALENFKDLTPSQIADLQCDPTMIDYAGDITAPDVYMPEAIGDAYSDITVDPQLAEAQMNSMGSMDQIIEGGGLTGMDKLNALRAQQASQLNASQQGMDIQQDMARRGLGGGGQELLMKLAASQGAVNSASESEQKLQAQARERALNAIQQKGAMATGMRTQASQEDQAKADAANSIAQFNTNLATGQHNQQAANQLAVDQANQNAQQGVNTANAGITNTANVNNAGAHNTLFDQQTTKATGLSGAQNKMASASDAAGNAKARVYTQGADMVNAGITKYGQQK